MAFILDALIGITSKSYPDCSKKGITKYHKGDLIKYLNERNIKQPKAGNLFKLALNHEDPKVLLEALELIEQYGLIWGISYVTFILN